MDPLAEPLAQMMERTGELLPEILAAALTIVLFALVGHALGAGLRRLLKVRKGQNRYARILTSLIRAAFALVGLVLGLQILGLTAVATSLLATGGLLAVILGFAFREIGENLLAGLFLGVSRSFDVGDLIESSGQLGKVREIDLRQVWIRSSDGRDIFIPSAQIFRNVLVNYTRDGLRRGDFVVGVDYADDIERARELLLTRTREVPDVLETPQPSVRISEFQSQYCELQVFFWIDTELGPGLSEVRSDVMAACLETLRSEGYTLSSDVSTAVAVTQVEGPHRPG